jgi:hypothetical protein
MADVTGPRGHSDAHPRCVEGGLGHDPRRRGAICGGANRPVTRNATALGAPQRGRSLPASRCFVPSGPLGGAVGSSSADSR